MSRSTLKAPRVRSEKRLDLKALAQPECWESVGDKITCRACLDGKLRDIRPAMLHERTTGHQCTVKRFLRIRREQAEANAPGPSTPSAQPQADAPLCGRNLLELFRKAKQSNFGRNTEQSPPDAQSNANAPVESAAEAGGLNSATIRTVSMNSVHARERLCESLMQFLKGDHLKPNMPSPESSSSSSEDQNAGVGTVAQSMSAQPRI